MSDESSAPDEPGAPDPTAVSADAPQPEPAASDPRAERKTHKDRVIRRRVLLTVAPLVMTAVFPWPRRSDEMQWSWEFAEQLGTKLVLVGPALALAMTVVGLAKKRSLTLRSLLIGVLGVLLGWVFFGLFTLPEFLRGLDGGFARLDVYAPLVFLGLPLLAITAELFSALERRSRLRALLAGGAWMTLIFGYFVPLRSDRVESMLFLVTTEAIDDALSGRERGFIQGAPLVFVFLLALLAAALTLPRLIGTEDERALRRPRSGCLAIGIPALMAVLAMLGALAAGVFDEWPMATLAWHGPAYLLAFFVGVPGAIAAGLDGAVSAARLARGENDTPPAAVRRARVAFTSIGALLVLALLTRFAVGLLPDRREARGAAEILALGEIALDSAMGAEPDPRFLFGYSEFDLRGSVGALRDVVGADATPTITLVTLEVTMTPDPHGRLLVGVDGEGTPHYLRFSQGQTPPIGDLERASPLLSEYGGYLVERLSSPPACLPVDTGAPSIYGLRPEPLTIGQACREVAGRGARRQRLRDYARRRGPSVGTGDFTIYATAGGTTYALASKLYSDQGRLWIGRLTVAEATSEPVPTDE